MNPRIKVLVFTKYDTKGASSRLRSIQYFEKIEQKKIKLEHSPLFEDGYIDALYSNSKISFIYIFKRYLYRFFKLLTIYKYDLIWIEKELFPWIPVVIEKILPIVGIPYMVDYDDAIFHNYDQHSKKIVRLLLGNKIPKVMKNATLVTVCNSYLEKKAIDSGAKKIDIIPTVIDLDRYQPIYDSYKKEFKIGWIGTPKTEKYLIELVHVFTRLSKFIDFKLIVIGGKNFKTTNFKYEILPWSEDREVEYLKQIDIGIMPLSDSQWEKGKCGYKLIQYMACGKPVVASYVGMNCEIIENDINGYLVKSEDEWISSFQNLENRTKRIEMGKNARKLVEKKYSLQCTIDKRINYITENVAK